MKTVSTNLKITRVEAGVLLLLTLSSFFGVNQYIFGLYNHYITLPFLFDVLQPELYPADPLIAERAYFYTYFLKALAWLVSVTGLEVQTVFAGVYFTVLYASFLAFFRLALDVSSHRGAAFFATLLFLVGIPVLGGVMTLESHLMERTMVLPVQLWAVSMFLRKRTFGAFGLLGLSFLIHPLSAIYLGGIFVFASLTNLKQLGWKRPLSGLAFMILLSLPALLLKFRSDAPPMPFVPEKDWLDLLRLRSVHHLFALSWPVFSHVTALLFTTGYFLLLRNQRGPHTRLLASMGLAVVLMCLAGLLFVEILPLTPAIQFQFFRSFRFLVYPGLIVYAVHLFKAAESPASFKTHIPVLLILALLYLGSDVMKFTAAFAFMLLIYPGRLFLEKRLSLTLEWYRTALLLFALALGVVGLWQRGGIQIDSGQEHSWKDVQSWVRTNSEINAQYIVPPNRWGFRVGAQRAIFGDWNDGTQAFFNPSFGREWMQRMSALGFEGDPDQLGKAYRGLSEQTFTTIAAEMPGGGPTELIMFSDRDSLAFPVRYHNDKYVIYSVGNSSP